MGAYKMLTRAIASLALLFGTVSAQGAEPFDPLRDPEVIYASLPATDCREYPAACRYYAAIEAVSYLDVCPKVYEIRIKTPFSGELLSAMHHALEKWSYLQPESLRSSVLNQNNALRHSMGINTINFLNTGTFEEMVTECTRMVGLIMNNESADNVSELVRRTKNWTPVTK